MGLIPPCPEAGPTPAEPKPRQVSEYLVKQRREPVDGRQVNDNLLGLIREMEKNRPLASHPYHGSLGLSRQHRAHLRADCKEVTVCALITWCNDRRFNSPYILALIVLTTLSRASA